MRAERYTCRTCKRQLGIHAIERIAPLWARTIASSLHYQKYSRSLRYHAWGIGSLYGLHCEICLRIGLHANSTLAYAIKSARRRRTRCFTSDDQRALWDRLTYCDRVAITFSSHLALRHGTHQCWQATDPLVRLCRSLRSLHKPRTRESVTFRHWCVIYYFQ